MSRIYTLFIASIICFGGTQTIEAQFLKKLAKKAEKAAERVVEKKVEEKAERDTEKALDSIFNSKPKQQTQQTQAGTNPHTKTGVSTGKFTSYSKFDFVSGEQLLVFEDFSQDEVGDLPAKWNASNSAEVVTLEGIDGKWMKIVEGKGAYVPDFITDFPDNFTLEFDLVYDFDISQYAYQRYLSLIFSDVENPAYQLDYEEPGNNGYVFTVFGGGSSPAYLISKKYTPDRQLNIESKKENQLLQEDNLGRGEVIHVSIWRQKQRMRVYFNEEKVYDIPRAFEKGVQINTARFFSYISEPETYFFISNLRYAVGKPDLRNKLITEGRLVTYGITFDVNSSKIKPSSYGTLKRIASILKQQPEIKVTIIGHTDADGTETANQSLSEQRANSVKNLLVEEFGIDANRLTTQGKGESELLDNGNSPESKAKNRRVEFVKQ